MIQDKRERSIAKIISVNAYKLEAELLSHITSFNINGFDDIYQFIRLNSYVLICIENNFIVASISSIKEKDGTYFTDKDALNKINATKILELFPLGVLEKEKFTFGVSNYPNLYSDVLYIKEKELNQLFSTNSENENLEIGTWTLMDKYKVNIDINNFFGFHSAILGNTGSGKSCTISALLQSIYEDNKYRKSQFIFFDVNGEYKQAFEKIKIIKLKYLDFSGDQKEEQEENKKPIKFLLPLNLLNIDEWELLLKASSKSQAPILRSALGLYSLCEKDENNDKKNEIKTYIFSRISKMLLEGDSNFTVSKIIANFQKLKNSKIPFEIQNHSFDKKPETKCLKFTFDSKDHYLGIHFGEIKSLDTFKKYISKLETDNTPKENISFDYKNDGNIKLKNLEEYIELAILWEEAHGNKQVRDYCSSLITRLKSLSRRDEFKFFSDDNTKIDAYIETLVKDRNITIINFDNIDDEVIEVVSAILSRMFFDYVKNQEKRNTKPIHLVLDEAHRYISNNKGKEYFFEANRIFERIAKEARKYGLFLILSSQRPSELNETVLSQCSNFIIHRIQNPNDLNYIKSMTPFISQAILNQLPSIPTQQALIFGTSIKLPVLFKVKEAKPLPNSDNNNIVENWK